MFLSDPEGRRGHDSMVVGFITTYAISDTILHPLLASENLNKIK
jgi:hypothetical protein